MKIPYGEFDPEEHCPGCYRIQHGEFPDLPFDTVAVCCDKDCEEAWVDYMKQEHHEMTEEHGAPKR